MNITPIPEKGFGAVVTGVRLSELSDDGFAALRAAWLERGFLLFPEQFLTDAENVAFGERFGELEFGANPMSNSRKQEDGSFGEVFGFRTQIMRTNVGNEAWHPDSTYKPISSKCAMLSAVTVPDEAATPSLRTCAPAMRRSISNQGSHRRAVGVSTRRSFPKPTMWATFRRRE